MKVFISWSGQPSRQVALALRDWLPVAIQAVQPYMSEQDNEAGVRWLETVSNELDTTNFGIICVTPNNVDSRWLNFEAGALSKAVDKARVVPLLYGFNSLSDLAPPLSQFQAKLANINGIRDLVKSINQQMDNPLAQDVLNQSFELAWPSLNTALDLIVVGPAPAEPTQRPERELLEEVLQLTRANQLLLSGIRRRGEEVVVTSVDESLRPRDLLNRIRAALQANGAVVEIAEDRIMVFNLSPKEITPHELAQMENMAKSINFDLKFYDNLGKRKSD